MKLYYVRLITPVAPKEKTEPVYELRCPRTANANFAKYEVDTLELRDNLILFTRDGIHGFTPLTNVNRAHYAYEEPTDPSREGKTALRAKGKGKDQG